jgi:hypothetical protein
MEGSAHGALNAAIPQSRLGRASLQITGEGHYFSLRHPSPERSIVAAQLGVMEGGPAAIKARVWPRSAMGPKAAVEECVCVDSALPLIADMCRTDLGVGFVPNPDITSRVKIVQRITQGAER